VVAPATRPYVHGQTWVSPEGQEWVYSDESKGWTRVTAIVPVKMAPMKCKRCDFVNEYIGPEHLDANGIYTCRSCKINPYR
jgi:hypothetical protein